jgi:site-specific recombinase XerD
LRALNLPLRHVGPHALRHACATHLLAEGLTMKEIGDHLGHRSADSTAHYARVDLTGLREVADFDLGGLL